MRRGRQRTPREELSTVFNQPMVFLDESELACGDEWEKRIRSNICKSISMIAICAPMYYRREHHWCGREWAAMEHLGTARLKSEE